MASGGVNPGGGATGAGAAKFGCDRQDVMARMRRELFGKSAPAARYLQVGTFYRCALNNSDVNVRVVFVVLGYRSWCTLLFSLSLSPSLSLSLSRLLPFIPRTHVRVPQDIFANLKTLRTLQLNGITDTVAPVLLTAETEAELKRSPPPLFSVDLQFAGFAGVPPQFQYLHRTLSVLLCFFTESTQEELKVVPRELTKCTNLQVRRESGRKERVGETDRQCERGGGDMATSYHIVHHVRECVLVFN